MRLNKKRSAFTPPRGAGFTLIEMLIVIVVISILIGVLLPGFRGAQDEAAEQITRTSR